MAIGLVAAGEGVVDEQSLRRHRLDDVVEDGAVQVAGDHYDVEAAPSSGFRRAVVPAAGK